MAAHRLARWRGLRRDARLVVSTSARVGPRRADARRWYPRRVRGRVRPSPSAYPARGTSTARGTSPTRNSGHVQGYYAQRVALREPAVVGVDIQVAAGRRARRPTLNLAGPDGVFGVLPPSRSEIGFKLGDFVEMARAHPDRNFLGCEVHKPGIGAALLKIHEGLTQHRSGPVMHALWLLRDFIPRKSLRRACACTFRIRGAISNHRRIVNLVPPRPLRVEVMTTWAPACQSGRFTQDPRQPTTPPTPHAEAATRRAAAATDGGGKSAWWWT